jgi:excinuclease UvrABC nuclease subunit
MFASDPHVISSDDEALQALPQSPGVFVIRRRVGEPYIGRTALLRRRLVRVLRIRGLREITERIEYWRCGSRLESSLVLYEVAKRLLRESYIEFLKLRFPPYVKLVSSNPFPRTQITSRLTGSGVFYGPFRSRASAEIFERQMLDLYQLRRCQEDLAPSPDHPGCIYGEMGMCLRPCQELVGVAEYATEAGRVAEFLRTNGKVALQSAESAREHLSEEMDFEEAARQHKRVERIAEVLNSRDELARDVDAQNGIAVTAGPAPQSVLLWFMTGGWWRAPVPFTLAPGQSLSMDQRLRETVSDLSFERGTVTERQEHLALLARWFYSSWRDGAWIDFASPERVSYRRVVKAISRVVHQNSPEASH